MHLLVCMSLSSLPLYTVTFALLNQENIILLISAVKKKSEFYDKLKTNVVLVLKFY